MTQDKRLSKKISPIVLGIGIPASLRMLSQYIQQIIDTMFVGQYNSEALEALSSVVVPFWMFESLWMSIAWASTVIIAQQLGSKNQHSAAKINQMTFLMGGVLSFVYFFWWQNANTLLAHVMNLEGNAAQFASDYVKIISLVYIVRFLGIAAPSSTLEAIGKTKVIMWASIFQSLTNIILDPIFIWGWGIVPEMGIKGAAYATVIAEVVAAVIISIYFWKHRFLRLKKKDFFPLQWDLKVRSIIGVPMMTETLLWSLSTSSIIAMMNKAFPLGGAVFNVGFLLSDMCFRLLLGFDIATVSLVGRAFGAKRKDRMGAILRAALWNKWVFGLIILSLLYLFRVQIVHLFSNDIQITQTTLDNFIWILLISLPTIPVGLNMSTLRAMGYSRYNLYVSLVAIPLRVVIAYYMIFYTDLGIVGVWLATFIEEFIRVVATAYFKNRTLHHYYQQWI